MENLKNASQKTEDQIEFLKFQLNEIDEANLNSLPEDEELNNELSVLENAEKAVGEGKYDFLHNNCEDLANRICYKKKLTSQVNDIKDKI